MISPKDYFHIVPIELSQFTNALPSQEQLKERMELLQKELRETKRLMNKGD